MLIRFDQSINRFIWRTSGAPTHINPAITSRFNDIHQFLGALLISFSQRSIKRRRPRKHRQTQVDGRRIEVLDRGTAKAYVVQALALGTHIDLDVAQRLSAGQLREGHSKELTQAGELLDFEVALMGCNAAAKSARWQMRHHLSEHELALMHGGLMRKTALNRESDIRCSNRDPMKMLKSASKSLTYDVLM